MSVKQPRGHVCILPRVCVLCVVVLNTVVYIAVSPTSFMNFFISVTVWAGFSVLSSARNALTASVNAFLEMHQANGINKHTHTINKKQQSITIAIVILNSFINS